MARSLNQRDTEDGKSVEKIITLLNKKNHFLEKFYSLNEDQILRLKKNHFDGLDSFYQSREDLLKVLQYVDEKIKKFLPSSQVSHLQEEREDFNETRDEIQEALKIKAEIVSQILRQDLEILSLIDKEKSSIISELQGVKKTQSVFEKYRFKLVM